MLVLDALFDHIQQISSNVEIIGSLVQFAQNEHNESAYGPIAVMEQTFENRPHEQAV